MRLVHRLSSISLSIVVLCFFGCRHSGLQGTQTSRGFSLILGDIMFATGKADLMPDAMHTTDAVADFLKENPKRSVLIEGFTDSTGSIPFNLKLSQQRADAVRDALVATGITNERITTRGYGEKFPSASNTTPEDRQKNRRVEIIILDEGVTAESKMR